MIYFISKQKSLFNDEEIVQCNLNDCIDYFKNHTQIELDSETTGLDVHTCRTYCWQLGDYDNQFILDSNSYSIKELEPLLQSKLVIIQNALFDLQFLYKEKVSLNKVYDTMLVEAVLTTGLGDVTDLAELTEESSKLIAEKYVKQSLGLDSLAKKYLDISIAKDLRKLIPKEGLSTRVLKYSAKDVQYLGKIKDKQLEIFNKYQSQYGFTDNLLELENEVVKVFARILFNGIKVDREFYIKNVLNIVNETVLSSIQNLNNTLYNSKVRNIKTFNSNSNKTKDFQIVFGGDLFNPLADNINWNSPEQKLGILKSFDKTLTTTSKIELAKRIELNPIFAEVIEYSKFKKLQDSFGEKLLGKINPITGKIHSNIKQVLSTGRISMSDPNLAQIPSKGDLGKVIRQSFIPRNKDYVIVGGDYSGCELRIIAEFSKDPLWIKTLNEGGDLHSVLCAETFDIDIKDVKTKFYANPDITYRDVQKTINFGLA